jgi:hypothetical protein
MGMEWCRARCLWMNLSSPDRATPPIARALDQHACLGHRPPAPEAIAAGPPSPSLRPVQQRLPIRMTNA